jgi:hypothetical protein
MQTRCGFLFVALALVMSLGAASTAERLAKRYYKGQETQKTRRARAVVIGGAR